MTIISQTKIIVRYAETDRMGIVHHSNYPIWFETARTDFIKKTGFSYSQMEERGFLLPLIELNCQYRASAGYEDEIIIKTKITDISYTRTTFYYEVFRVDLDKPITAGRTMHVWTDKKLKPLNIKKHAPDIYKLMLEASKM